MTPESSKLYWERRSAARMKQYQKGADATIRAIRQAYAEASGSLLSSINALFERYARRYGLTREEAKAILMERVDERVLENWQRAVDKMPDGAQKRAMRARLNAPSVRYRITNMQAMREQAAAVCSSLEEVELQKVNARLLDAAEEAYLLAEYDLQKGLGFGWQTTGISRRVVDAILRENWSGENYKTRIRRRAQAMAERTQVLLLDSMMGGDSRAEIAAKLSAEFDASVMSSMRLVATEITHVTNAAELERYKDNGIAKYMFRAILDLRTSDICQDHDGIVYDVADAKTGENFPPLHPWCRSTTVQVINREWLQTAMRTAVDPVTGEHIRIPATMRYSEWKDKLVIEHGRDRVAEAQKRQQQEAQEKRRERAAAAKKTVYVEMKGERAGIESGSALKERSEFGIIKTTNKSETMTGRSGEGMIVTDKQMGQKAGKHMKEWGLDPSRQEDRQKFVEITRNIRENPDEIRRVEWLHDPTTGRRTIEVNAYIKEADVVLTNDSGVYISTMKDGVNNKRVRNGKKVKK